MKLSFFILAIGFIGMGLFSACSKAEEQPTSILPSGNYRLVSPEEISNLGFQLSQGNGYERTITCSWADNYGGSMSCNGDHCSVIQYYPTGQVGIGCFDGDQLVSSGLYRN